LCNDRADTPARAATSSTLGPQDPVAVAGQERIDDRLAVALPALRTPVDHRHDHHPTLVAVILQVLSRPPQPVTVTDVTRASPLTPA
jgi:hypothetical protein